MSCPYKEHATGIELTPFDERFRADPYPILEQVRAREPVHYDRQLSRWFVADHQTVHEALRSRELSNNSHRADPESYSGRIAANAAKAGPGAPINSMLFMDDPEHRRLRSLVSKPFGAKAVEAMRPRIRALAEELLDAIPRGRFDLIARLAAPLPVMVIAEMLGIERGLRAQFREWSDGIVESTFNPLNDTGKAARGAEAQKQFNEYLLGIIAERRREPCDDLIGAMVTANEDAVPLTDAEILSQSSLLLIAGNATTTDLIGNGMKALLEHPSELAALRSRPELIGNAVEEMLRFDTPVVQATRVFLKDTTLGGCAVRAGQSATVALAAANRDPALNPEPDRFDIRRENIEHVSFGGGKHLCLGAWLARVEAQEAISALLDRFPVLRLAPQSLRYRSIPIFRGLEELWLEST